MTEDLNAPALPDWAAIRLRYEAGAEKVPDIAADIGMARITLSLHAKAQGWLLRGAAKAKAGASGPSSGSLARASLSPEGRGAEEERIEPTSPLAPLAGRGWRAAPGEGPRRKSETTTQTLQRLKDILTTRISHLEGDLEKIGEDVKALSNERDIRAANTLVRTLEKVLELEHRERKNRARRARESLRLNDAEREELARRVAGLCDAGPGKSAEPRAYDPRGAQAAVGLAAVGEAGPASAAG
jgi:hypothetical protein